MTTSAPRATPGSALKPPPRSVPTDFAVGEKNTLALMHCGLELSAGNQREHERLVFRQRGGELLVAARHKILLTAN